MNALLSKDDAYKILLPLYELGCEHATKQAQEKITELVTMAAIIAKKDNALKLSAAVFSGDISDKAGMVKVLELLREAIALTADSVEVVEICNVKDAGIFGKHIEFSESGKVKLDIGDKLYTIKVRP